MRTVRNFEVSNSVCGFARESFTDDAIEVEQSQKNWIRPVGPSHPPLQPMSQPSSEEAATEAPQQTELLRDASDTPDSTSDSKTAAEDGTDESKSAASPVAQSQPRRVVMQQPIISYQGVDMRYAQTAMRVCRACSWWASAADFGTEFWADAAV